LLSKKLKGLAQKGNMDSDEDREPDYDKLYAKPDKAFSPTKKQPSIILKREGLPKDFADQVLNKEMLIESGKFNLDTVNSLLILYSKAVEYYSGFNDEKYTFYADRI
jgi:hypothetical protein